jgi:propanol-preferring alcohol dehydrogenase
VRAGRSASMASGRQRISSSRSRNGRADACLLSPARAIKPRRILRARSVPNGGDPPPEPLDVAIIFAPVGALLPAALKAVKKGGRAVCGGIHMSDIPSFPYALLWQEREVVSVANLTRADAREFLEIAPKAGVKCQVTRYPLLRANEALSDLREGRLQGAAVLIP